MNEDARPLLVRKMSGKKSVSVKSDEVILTHDRGTYSIPLSLFSSLDLLMNQIHHLQEKNWLTTDMLIEILEVHMTYRGK